MSRAEFVDDGKVISSLESQIAYLRKELDKYEKAVGDLKSAYQSEAKAASRSRVLREAIMKLVEL